MKIENRPNKINTENSKKVMDSRDDLQLYRRHL